MADQVDPPGEIMAPKIRPGDIGSSIKREFVEVDGWKWCKTVKLVQVSVMFANYL